MINDLGTFQLNDDEIRLKHVNVFKNEIELKDSWFHLGLPGQS
jgi:hypothetical protein